MVAAPLPTDGNSLPGNTAPETSRRPDWDARFASEPCHLGTDPEPFVVAQAASMAAGSALDAACGEGRHAVALARIGFDVVALDRSVVGVAKVTGLARTLGAPRHRIHPVAADLTTLPLPRAYFQLIVMVNFLERDIFPALVEALTPGGVLLFQSFGIRHHGLSEHGPRNPAFMLRPGEILSLVSPLRVVLHEDLIEPWPSRGGRRAVVRVRAEKSRAGRVRAEKSRAGRVRAEKS